LGEFFRAAKATVLKTRFRQNSKNKNKNKNKREKDYWFAIFPFPEKKIKSPDF
jgi:hypothetical protein